MLTMEISRERSRARLAELLDRCDSMPTPRPFMRDGCMYGVQTIHAQIDLAYRVLALRTPDFQDMRRAEDGLRAAFSIPL